MSATDHAAAFPHHPHADRSADSGVQVHPLIAARWSPRNLDPDAEVTPAELLATVEAARVAASWGGTFPVRFLAGLRGDATHAALTAVLDAGNAWAAEAGALLLVAAQTANDKGEMPYALFDAGLAVAQLSLQAVAEGLVSHPMAGFDPAAARAAFAVPDEFTPVVIVALGRLRTGDHPDPEITARDRTPRPRPDLATTVFTGSWGVPLPGAAAHRTP